MLSKKLFVGVLALGLSSIAFANGDSYAPPAPAYNPGIYVGLQGGYGMTHTNPFLANRDEDGFAGRVFLGYDFHPNFAVEAGFTYFFNEPQARVAGVRIYDMNIYIIDLVGKIKAKIMDNFGLYAKAGVNYMIHNYNRTPAAVLLPGSADSFGPTFGVGAYYEFTPNITADLSYTRFAGNPYTLNLNNYTTDKDLIALGLSYKFNIG